MLCKRIFQLFVSKQLVANNAFANTNKLPAIFKRGFRKLRYVHNMSALCQLLSYAAIDDL